LLLAAISLKSFNLTGHSTAEKEINEEEAIIIAKEFVDEYVKFYTTNENTGDVVKRASITVIDIYKNGKEWNIEIHVISNVEGEEKTAGLMIVVDSEKGEVIKEKLKQFRIRE